MRDFDKRFPTEAKCLDFLAKLRWKDGFFCSKCGETRYWKLDKGLRKCAACSFENSVTVGTIFQDSHLSLKTWFYAIWLVTSQKTGISALGLKGGLGLGSYHTAWLLLQKIRRTMVIAERSKLSRDVEVDETFIGGFAKTKRGRDADGKRLVVIAAEVHGKKIGRIRMKHIQNASARTLLSFIQSEVEPRAIVRTDGWLGYANVGKHGFVHEATSAKSMGIDEVMPRIHLVSSLLKRWFLGTFQGKCDAKYLGHYLNEYVFRFNRRTSNTRGLLFYRVLENALITKPITSRAIKLN